MTDAVPSADASADRADTHALLQNVIRPQLEALADPSGRPGRGMQRMTLLMGGGFFSFIALHTLVENVVPDTFFGQFIAFLSFPILFFACMGAALFLGRGWVMAFIEAAQARFIVRSHSLKALAAHYGLEYVSVPGGEPALKWLAAQRWAPERLRALSDLFDRHGGMDDALGRARASGILQPEIVLLGTQEQKRRYLEQTATLHNVEDGFSGQTNGVRFDLFEWVEDRGDDPDIRHLILILDAPLRLNGVTQLRTRGAGWPVPPDAVDLAPVDLGPRAFAERFDVRANDQTEARAVFNPAVMERLINWAHGGKVRAVAVGKTLAISVAGAAGENRFNLIDLKTGAWSDETLRQTARDIEDALGLAGLLAHAFMLRPSRT